LLNGKGIIEYESGEYLEALESFKEGLQYRSSSRALLINLGAVSCKLGRNLEALSTVKKALRANPTDAETWNRFGYIQATMGKPDEAIVSLLKAVELAPRVAAYHESAAVLYGVVNRPDEATRALARARELAAEPEQEYLRILEEAILGDLPRAAERLRLAEATGKIPGHAIRRDPNLTLLFASDKTDAQRG
jgi:Flp pilus assembly protein TadD